MLSKVSFCQRFSIQRLVPVFYSTFLSIQDFRFRVQSWFPGSTVQKNVVLMCMCKGSSDIGAFKQALKLLGCCHKWKACGWLVHSLPKATGTFQQKQHLSDRVPPETSTCYPLIWWIYWNAITSLLKITTPPASLSLWRLWETKW